MTAMRGTLLALSLLCGLHLALTLDNGLARTPPMGWLSWERFRCNTDCENDPENCIGEKLFMKMADLFVSEGYRDAGYEYINIDDCWLARERAADGQLAADPDRFPSGIKALADYVHARGLKLGIYEDFGTKTCGGYPGSEYHLQMDAQTFADWGVDFLKLDGCYSDPKQYSDGYPPVAFFLKKTGRSIVLSCEYPLYEMGHGIVVNYTRVQEACNLCRNSHDMQDSWASVNSIIGLYAANKYDFAAVAGPGYYNDPDELIIGNFGLSWDQQRVQMAMWSIMASPLIMSVDLRTIRNESKALLQNKGAITINQDPLGIQGRCITTSGSIQIWTKPIMPQGSFAFAYLNVGDGGTPSRVSMKLADMGMTHAGGYTVTEAFSGELVAKMLPNSTMSTLVNPSGVFFGKAAILM